MLIHVSTAYYFIEHSPKGCSFFVPSMLLTGITAILVYTFLYMFRSGLNGKWRMWVLRLDRSSTTALKSSLHKSLYCDSGGRQWGLLEGGGGSSTFPRASPEQVPCDITCFHVMHGSATNLESFHLPWQFDGISPTGEKSQCESQVGRGGYADTSSRAGVNLGSTYSQRWPEDGPGRGLHCLVRSPHVCQEGR